MQKGLAQGSEIIIQNGRVGRFPALGGVYIIRIMQSLNRCNRVEYRKITAFVRTIKHGVHPSKVGVQAVHLFRCIIVLRVDDVIVGASQQSGQGQPAD